MSTNSPLLIAVVLCGAASVAYYFGYKKGETKKVSGNKVSLSMNDQQPLKQMQETSKPGWKMPIPYGYEPKYRYSRFTGIL